MDDHALPVLDRKRIEEELKFKLKNNVGEVVLTLLIVVLLFFSIPNIIPTASARYEEVPMAVIVFWVLFAAIALFCLFTVADRVWDIILIAKKKYYVAADYLIRVDYVSKRNKYSRTSYYLMVFRKSGNYIANVLDKRAYADAEPGECFYVILLDRHYSHIYGVYNKKNYQYSAELPEPEKL